MHDGIKDSGNVKQKGYEVAEVFRLSLEDGGRSRYALPLLSESSRIFTSSVCDWKVKNMHLCATRTIKRILDFSEEEVNGARKSHWYDAKTRGWLCIALHCV